VVPGDHRVPIRAKRDGPSQKHVRQNAYYIRRPGPKSEQPQSGREWDELLGRCLKCAREDLLGAIRDILHGGPSRPLINTPQEQLAAWETDSLHRWNQAVEKRYGGTSEHPLPSACWTATYCLTGGLQPKSLTDFLEVLRHVQGHETGWPPWLLLTPTDMAPYPYENTIECLIGDPRTGPAHADFWRASPQGMMFLVRGYQEDEPEKCKPGSMIDVALPIWRVGECLLHAGRLAKTLGTGQNDLVARFRWNGLSGRVLSTLDPMRCVPSIPQKCRQDLVQSVVTLPTDTIDDALPEVVREATRPLYQAFDFTDLSDTVFAAEIRELR
jgi:hypothetical protein